MSSLSRSRVAPAVGKAATTRPARLSELADRVEEGLDLGRRQVGGWLVEDDDVGAVVEQLHQLDALAATEGQAPHGMLGVDRQAVACREPLGQLAKVPLQDEPGRLAVAERDVLGRGEA